MRTAAVIVTHNNPGYTADCVDSLLKSDGEDYGIIVVDNDSSDGALRTLFKALSQRAPARLQWTGQRGQVVEAQLEGACTYLAVVPMPSNRGYGPGNNAGARLARARGAEFVWILNDDTRVDRRALNLLEQRARNSPNAGAVGALVLEYGDDEIVQAHGGAQFNPITTRNRYLDGGRTRTAVQKRHPVALPDYIAGASMFCPLHAFFAVDGLSEDYIAYYEEVDYCERLRRAGYSMAVESEAIVYHKGGVSLGSSNSVRLKSPTAAYYSTRSALTYVRRYHPWAFPAAAVMRLGYALRLYVVNRRAGVSAFLGLFEGIRRGPTPGRFEPR